MSSETPHPAQEEPQLSGQSPPKPVHSDLSHPYLADYKRKEKLVGAKVWEVGASWHLPVLQHPVRQGSAGESGGAVTGAIQSVSARMRSDPQPPSLAREEVCAPGPRLSWGGWVLRVAGSRRGPVCWSLRAQRCEPTEALRGGLPHRGWGAGDATLHGTVIWNKRGRRGGGAGAQSQPPAGRGGSPGLRGAVRGAAPGFQSWFG